MDAPLAYISKLTLQNAHVFSDPGPSINPLPEDERHSSSDRPSTTIYAL